MQIVTFSAAVILAIGIQFLPLVADEAMRPSLQALTGLSAFFLGINQGAFGKYLSDLWTDRRRSSEQESRHKNELHEIVQRCHPFLQRIRNALSGNEEKFNNDLDIVMSEGNISFAEGTFLRIKAGVDYDKFKSMAKRLQAKSLLSISRDEDKWMRFQLEDRLYHEILNLSPDGG